MPDLRIEVVYALAREQRVEHIAIAAGSTVRDAIERSGILRYVPSDAVAAYGIFGRRVTPDQRLSDGDRIEIYRALQMDPRAARRARAKLRGGPKR